MSEASEVDTIDAQQAEALRSHSGWRLERHRASLSPHGRDEGGNGPLHLACQPQRPSDVSLPFLQSIVQFAPALDSPNSKGWTPLALAVLFLPAPAVRLLAETGSGCSAELIGDALRLAANYERADVTAALLDLGGHLFVAGERREGPLSFAARFDRHETHLLDLDGLAGLFPVLDRAVARKDQARPEVLTKLAASRDRGTLRAVTRNPNTPSEVLFSLAPRFPRPFFCNPVFDWLLLEDPERIFEMGQGVIRNILRLKGCPESMIQWAVSHGTDSERLAVIRRGDTPPEVLRAIAAKSKGRVRALAVAHDPDASPASLLSAVGLDETADRLIAEHRHSDAWVLDRLCESTDEVVCQRVLRHPLASEQVRRKLDPGRRVVHRLMGPRSSPTVDSR